MKLLITELFNDEY